MLQTLAILGLFLPTTALASKPSREDLDFFEKKIRPVLIERCSKCHSTTTKKSRGGLRLDSRSELLRGGDTGPAIVPGHPERSLLIRALRYTGDNPKMPPKGKLPDKTIRDFEDWVRRGAAWPDSEGDSRPEKTARVITKEDREFWSFRPVRSVKPPRLENADWVRNPIDAFVLRKLREHGLEPSASADRRTLLRRASFDLTGLPPTPEMVDSFLADESPDAFSKVVDRLLASTRYGERWARHWLDGVRYVSDVGYYNFSDLGWRYRDWVVSSYNSGRPYDDFVAHQIAGDLLPAPKGEPRYREGIIATGVLAMGNYDDQESNKENLYVEVIDDQIDVVGRQFLGLTLSCARCHDHKFDPILQTDYYALGGIFLSSRVLKTGNRIGAHRLKIPLTTGEQSARHSKWQNQLQQAEQALDSMADRTSPVADELRRKIVELRSHPRPEPGETIGIQEGGYSDSRHKSIGDMRLYVRGNPHNLGEVVPRRLPIVFEGEGQVPIGKRTKRSGRLELARWIASPSNPLTARVMVNRIWQHHFGAGLVRTPSNFGSRGERPTHPELLDYLAGRFVQSGWSVKSLHRLIMNSSTYQQSSRGAATLSRTDPENRWLGRFSTRRLSAEELHDASLFVSGQLKPGLGQGRGNRALYYRQGHEHSWKMGLLFDQPAVGTIAPKRTNSTVAPQSLFLMNDPFVIRSAKEFARRIGDLAADDDEQVALAYRWAFGREPTERERDVGRRYLASRPRAERWTYFQVLLCSNEWAYVD